MPQDPFAKVAIGDPVSFAAQSWNAIIDAAKGAQPKGNLNASSLIQTRSATIIRVRNDSGMNLDRNTVLGLGDPIFTPDDATTDIFLREVTFKGLVPDINKHKRTYVVMLDPSVPAQVVRAYIAGVCQVQVEQQDHTHEYANIINAQTGYLRSSRFGHARILWREGLQGGGYGYYDVGIQWAVVMLGVTGSCFAVGRAHGDITPLDTVTGAFGTGSVDIHISNSVGYEDGPVEEIHVLNASPDLMAGSSAGIQQGAWCSVAWDADDVAWVAPLQCEADPYGY